MSTKLNLSFILFVLVQVISGQQKCRTPTGPIGRCIPFKSCEPLSYLSNRGQLTPAESDLVVKSYCDPFNGVPMICCPIWKSNTKSPTVNQNRAKDFTTHPNIRLLDLRQCGKSSSDKIANGNKTELYEFPWMALLRVIDGDKLSIICGGSLISKRYVLTAAHCLVTVQGAIPIHSVLLGEYNTETEPDCIDDDCADPVQEMAIEQQIPHPEFSTSTARNDIGLLRLQRNAQMSDSVVPICLPITLTSQNEELSKIIVTGWGTTEKHVPSTILLKAILDVTPLSKCTAIYTKRYMDRVTVDSTSLCAYDSKSDTCSGDSGGPAAFLAATDRYGPRVFQYGVVSAGARECATNYGIPGLYTRVTSYMNWILDNISD